MRKIEERSLGREGGRRRGLLGEERKIPVGTRFYIQGDRREIPWDGGRGRGLLGEERKITVVTRFYMEGDRREIPWEEEGGGEVSLVKKGRLWGLGSIEREIEERSLGRGRRRGLLGEERKITVGTRFYIEEDRREIPWEGGRRRGLLGEERKITVGD